MTVVLPTIKIRFYFSLTLATSQNCAACHIKYIYLFELQERLNGRTMSWAVEEGAPDF